MKLKSLLLGHSGPLVDKFVRFFFSSFFYSFVCCGGIWFLFLVFFVLLSFCSFICCRGRRIFGRQTIKAWRTDIALLEINKNYWTWIHLDGRPRKCNSSPNYQTCWKLSKMLKTDQVGWKLMKLDSWQKIVNLLKFHPSHNAK